MTDVIQPAAASSTSTRETRVEYVMLCDSAQTSQEGKLYVLGGGWSQITRMVPPLGIDAPPPATQFAIAASFLVDWNDANRPIGIRMTIETQDERPPLYEAQAQITAGRPPNTIPGDPLRVLIAFPILVQFPDQGAYCVRAQMEGAPQDIVVRFQVANALMMVPPGASGQ